MYAYRKLCIYTHCANTHGVTFTTLTALFKLCYFHFFFFLLLFKMFVYCIFCITMHPPPPLPEKRRTGARAPESFSFLLSPPAHVAS